MPAFEYIAVDADGKKQKGLLEADSIKQVRQMLREKNWLPVSVEQAANEHKSTEKKLFLFGGGMSAWDLALVTRQLATLVKAGIPLEECLRAVSKQSAKPTLQSLLVAVRARVVEGYSLSQAMAEFPNAFPPLYRATIAAGEKSGYLELVLLQLADYTESRYTTQKKVKNALIYPIILTILSILIVMGLLTYVVPDIVKVFESSKQQLPFITRALIGVSSFLKTYGIFLLLGLMGTGFWFNKKLKEVKNQIKLDAYILTLPFIGNVVKGLNAARFASTLSILARSGVPLVEALKIAAEVSSNQVICAAIKQVAVKVTEGGSLSRALEDTQLFPPMMLQMISSGEQGGDLDSMLDKAADMQDKEMDNLITTVVSLFEPLMLVIMAFIVLTIVLAIMLPILNMNSLIK